MHGQIKPMTDDLFKPRILARHANGRARVTEFDTAHGTVTTPTFMPVATRAFMNYLTPPDITATGSQMILGGNTYHMLIAPGMEVIEASGGMHRFMNWSGPMLTDSGGFQVFSLSQNKKICKIDEQGAHFKHPMSGQVIDLNPQSSIDTQKIIGADVIMAFDECTPESGGIDRARLAMDRTHRWAQESIEAHQKSPNTPYGYQQGLFGIIQGGRFRELRERSAEFLTALPFDGFALGGESIGFDMALTCEILEWLNPILPDHQLRYTMGVGLMPQDLLDVMAHGIDLFDCVAPTRNARHGSLYDGHFVIDNQWPRFVPHSDKGKLLIKKAIHKTDQRPICESCPCWTCQHYTRAYLHYLFKQQSLAYIHLATCHNVTMMQMACQAVRDYLMDGQDTLG